MILGFISLVLVFIQNYVEKICVPSSVVEFMLPCPRLPTSSRIGYGTKSLCKKGHVQLLSPEGLHELHLFIFLLAVCHVVFSAITMGLGQLKIRHWKQWERETVSLKYQFAYDLSNIRFTRQTTFVRSHVGFWAKTPISLYIGCFFRHFFQSINKSDYWTLRHGFLTAHLTPRSTFDFQEYIKKSLEYDLIKVVGVSPILWTSFVVFLLVNVTGSYALYWGSLVPLFIILAVGTKLQSILTCMALEITYKHTVILGAPVVIVSDSLFWFGRPEFLLHLFHFALFQNSFQLVYYFWRWYAFQVSCGFFHAPLFIVKVGTGVLSLFLCSYVTLPLYSIISQMSSLSKKSIFDELCSKTVDTHLAMEEAIMEEELTSKALPQVLPPGPARLLVRSKSL